MPLHHKVPAKPPLVPFHQLKQVWPESTLLCPFQWVLHLRSVRVTENTPVHPEGLGLAPVAEEVVLCSKGRLPSREEAVLIPNPIVGSLAGGPKKWFPVNTIFCWTQLKWRSHLLNVLKLPLECFCHASVTSVFWK
uniref:Uncharacterized protein n=1 Tax=Arundo donax TaxID=35708 RepID=A0A0A9F3F7_ARUDO